MRPLIRRSILRLMAAVVFALPLAAGVSCNAPDVFIPIPPPNPAFGPPSQEFDSDGVVHTYWKVTSPPSSELSSIYVYLTNIDMGPGTVGSIARTDQDGSYSTRIEGQQGNRILFNFGLDGGVICRPLREGVADTPCP